MNFLKNTIILILGAVVLSSCSEMIDFFRKDAISATPVSPTLNAAPQTLVLDIKASEGWTAKSTGKWISLDPYSGGRETEQVTASISSNTVKESRTDTIKFVCGKASLDIVVTQEGIESILSTVDLVLNETASFSMEAFSSWRITTTDTKATPEWFEVSPTSGEAGHVDITVKSLQDNVWANDRNAFVKVEIGGAPFYLTVTQKHVDAILESKDKVEVPSEGGVFPLSLRSNVDYVIEYSDTTNWLSGASGPDSKAAVTTTEYFRVEPNEAYDSRESFLVIKGSVINDTVRIFQAQKDALILNKDTLTVNFYGASHRVELRTNIEYSVTISQTGDWIRTVSPQALRTDQVFLKMDENTTSTSRKAVVVFKDINSSLSDTLYVLQESSSKLPFLNETIYGIYPDQEEASVYRPFVDQLSISNGNFRIQNFRDKNYINFSNIPSSLAKNDTFQVRILQNYSNDIEYDMLLDVIVVKVSDNLAWLYSEEEGMGFIIIK